MVHVPYRGETLVLQDMLGGHVDLFFGNVSAGAGALARRQGQGAGGARHEALARLPDVPTTAEAGLPGLVSTGWFALAGPPKLPARCATRSPTTVIEVLKMPDVQAKFRTVSIEPGGGTPGRDRGLHQGGSARWGEVIKKNNIVVD